MNTARVSAANFPLVQAFLVANVPSDMASAAEALNVPACLFGAVRDGAYQADFDLPRGSSWRVLPTLNLAMWMSRDAGLVPPFVASEQAVQMDLFKGLLRLAEAGFWLGEARLARGGQWTAPVAAPAVFDMLARTSDVEAIAGTWGDVDGRATYAEFAVDGRVWTENHARAQHWLLMMSGHSE